MVENNPDHNAAQWLRGAVGEVIPGAVADRQKIRRGFDLLGLSSLLKTASWENRWREIDSRAAHRELYGKEPDDVGGDAVDDEMIVLGDYKVNVNDPPAAAPPTSVPPAPQQSVAPAAAKFGLGTMLALAAGSGLAGAAIPAAISALSSPSEPFDFTDTIMIPELTGDWEKVEPTP